MKLCYDMVYGLISYQVRLHTEWNCRKGKPYLSCSILANLITTMCQVFSFWKSDQNKWTALIIQGYCVVVINENKQTNKQTELSKIQ